MPARAVRLRERDRSVTAIGESAVADDLEIPGVRVRPVARFPYLVFYVVGDEVVDVWRILHTRRDVPTAMSDDSDT